MIKTDEFLTPGQIAEQLQLNILTVYGYIRQKKLAAIKLGRSYRVTKIDFGKFLQEHKTTR